jgi:hypothetical protein
MVPEDGVTVTLAVTLNTALAKSFSGVPTTRIVQFLSSVAYGPTMKLPVAVVDDGTVHVGEVSTTVFGVYT